MTRNNIHKLFFLIVLFTGFVLGVTFSVPLFGALHNFLLTDLRFFARSIELPFGAYFGFFLAVPVIVLISSLFLIKHYSHKSYCYIGFFLISFTSAAILSLGFFFVMSFPFIMMGFGHNPYETIRDHSDRKIIRDLENGHGVLEEYFLSINQNSFEGFCEYETGNFMGYANFYKDLHNIYNSHPVCHDNETEWAAEAKLIREGKSWCVDSTGYSGLVPDGTVTENKVSCS